MKTNRNAQRTVFSVLSCLLVMWVLTGAAHAVTIDDKHTMELTAKLQTRVSFRLQDSEGYTAPKLSVGDLAQWRSIAHREAEKSAIMSGSGWKLRLATTANGMKRKNATPTIAPSFDRSRAPAR